MVPDQYAHRVVAAEKAKTATSDHQLATAPEIGPSTKEVIRGQGPACACSIVHAAGSNRPTFLGRAYAYQILGRNPCRHAIRARGPSRGSHGLETHLQANLGTILTPPAAAATRCTTPPQPPQYVTPSKSIRARDQSAQAPLVTPSHAPEYPHRPDANSL